MTKPSRCLPSALLAATAAVTAVTTVAAVTACTSPPASRPPHRRRRRRRQSKPATSPALNILNILNIANGYQREPGELAQRQNNPRRPSGRRRRGPVRPYQLTVPSGWTVRVWARVNDARMEAWTPEGDLLVSTPNDGSIMELTPDVSGTPTVTTLLSGLTYPQGMAFAQLNHQWVLYVGGIRSDRPLPVGPARDQRRPHRDREEPARPRLSRRRRAPPQGRDRRRRRDRLLQRRQLVQRQPRRPDDDAAPRGHHVRPPRRHRPAGGRAWGPQRRGPRGRAERRRLDRRQRARQHPLPSRRAARSSSPTSTTTRPTRWCR